MKNITKTSLFLAVALTLTACSNSDSTDKLGSSLKPEETTVSTTTSSTTTSTTTTTTTTTPSTTKVTTTVAPSGINTKALLSKDFSPIAGNYKALGGTYSIKANGSVSYEDKQLKIVGVTEDKGRVILTLQFIIEGVAYPNAFTFMHVTPAGVESPDVIVPGVSDNINKDRIFVQGEGNNFFFLN